MSRVGENFESALALLGWASDDLNSLERSVRRYFAKKPYEEVTELDPETDSYAHKLRFIKAPPKTWRKLTFRVVCDLRHCIDQAMFAAVQTVSADPPEGDVYFPWARDPTDLTYRRKKIPEVLWPTLDRLEPYRRGDDYTGGDDTIYAIRNAAGPNKHRIAIIPQARPTGFSIRGRGTDRTAWRIPYDGWDSSKNEFTIMYGLEAASERNYDVEINLDIGFGDVEGLQGKPVLPVLDHFGRYTQFVILTLMQDAEQITGL